MKKTFACCIGTLLLFTIIQTGRAQITISISSPPLGDPIIMKSDTSVATAALKLDQSGALDWTFNDVLDMYEGTFQDIPMSGTPDAGNPALSGAQWASRIYQYLPAIPELGMEEDYIDFYGYNRINGGWIEEVGLNMEHPMLTGSPFVYGEAAKLYPNPLTSNAEPWLERRAFNPLVAALGMSLNGSVVDSSIVQVDAWGALTIPAGTFDCLRIKRHEFRFITALLGTIPLYDQIVETWTYVWLTKDYQVLLYVTGAGDKGESFTIADVIMRAESGMTACDPDICDPIAKPESCTLLQNHPNPFNPSTMIPYELAAPARVELNIYNIQGQLVQQLVSGVQSFGRHEVVWNGTDINGQIVPAGAYLFRLKAVPLDQSEPVIQTRKMLLTY